MEARMFKAGAWIVLLFAWIWLTRPAASRAAFVAYISGTSAPVHFTLTITNRAAIGTGWTSAAPAPGTPAFTLFPSNKVDYNARLVGLQGEAVVAHVLTGLNSNRRYRLQGTTIRGPYRARWTQFDLAEAQDFTASHTANCLTSGEIPSLRSNQVLINVGENELAGRGDVFDWADVQPSPEGRLVIYSRLNLAPNPSGIPEPYAYALAFLRVEEFGTNPPR